MNTSSNFQFNLPQSTDTVDISKLSDNWDKIDTQLQNVKSRGEATELFVGLRANLQTDSTATIVSAINEVDTNTNTNATNLDKEISRAKGEESKLSSSISTEVERAKKAEQANADAVSTEKTRAEGAESTLTTNLNNEITRAKGAESANSTAISEEVTRAKAAEKTNSDAIAVLNGTGTGSVSKQVSDAIAKVVASAPEDFDTLKEISDWISTHNTDAATMNSAITTNASNLSAEITRAKGAESTNANAISAEKTRAENAESKNSDAISAEVTRAKSAEKTNSDAISAEKTRAEGVESTLTTNLNAEIERAKAAEQANADAIANMGSGGSGGVGSEAKCAYVTPRWLRFDPDNKRGLIIKGGTHIKNSSGDYVDFTEDTKIDMTPYITENGKDYYVYMSDAGDISAYTEYQSEGVKIGRFHTLCVDVGTIDMIAPYSPNSATVGMDYLIKSYRQENDPDFYAFYNKAVTAVTTQSYYDVCTMAHPLSGYVAKDILPESIFCLSWDTETLYEDAMVYDRDTNTVADIYLQSGTGLNTKSVYGATHTVLRQAFNYMEDMRQVGKKLLGDTQFSSFAIGSNEKTSITGSTDATTVGGHIDTNSRRMISAVGCEEMCGYLYQWLDELTYYGSSSWTTTDGNASFGQEYGNPSVLRAGGSWGSGSACGSRCRRATASRSAANADSGGRGSSQVRTVCV